MTHTVEKVRTHDDTTPAAWIGCLACYNDGRLVGEWYRGADALEEFTPPDDCAAVGHDEFWVFEHDNLGSIGECSPLEAYQIARALEELYETADDVGVPHGIAARYVTDSNAPRDAWPSIEDGFSFESFEDYAAEMIATCFPRGFDFPSWLQVDWESSGLELLEYDHSIYQDADTGTLYAFPNY